MSNLQPYHPASKIRVAQKADALFWGGWEQGEREKRMKKNYLYPPNASQIRKYIRHISKPTKFVNGLQGTSKTFCKSRTTESVDLLAWLYFSTTLLHPRWITKACIWCAVVALFQFSLPLKLSGLAHLSQDHGIIQSWKPLLAGMANIYERIAQAIVQNAVLKIKITASLFCCWNIYSCLMEHN